MGKPEGQVVGQGGPHTSLVPLPSIPPGTPRGPQDVKGLQGLGPGAGPDVRGRDPDPQQHGAAQAVAPSGLRSDTVCY